MFYWGKEQAIKVNMGWTSRKYVEAFSLVLLQATMACRESPGSGESLKTGGKSSHQNTKIMVAASISMNTSLGYRGPIIPLLGILVIYSREENTPVKPRQNISV